MSPISDTFQRSKKARTKKHMLDLTLWRSLGSFALFNLMGWIEVSALMQTVVPAGPSTGPLLVMSGVNQFNAHNKMSPSSSLDYIGFPPGFFKFCEFPNTYLPSPSKQLAHSTDPQVLFPDFSLPFSGFSHFFFLSRKG